MSLTSIIFLDSEIQNITGYAENHKNANGMRKNLNQHHHVSKI